MNRYIYALPILLGFLSSACDPLCGISYGTADRGGDEEEALRTMPDDASEDIGTSQSALRPATNGAGLAPILVCLFAGGKCGNGVHQELEAGETKVLDEAPCTDRPFPTPSEAKVSLGPTSPWLSMGYEPDEYGTERFVVRADADVCDPTCPRTPGVEITITWLPTWSATPFRDTIEYTRYSFGLKGPK